MGLFISHPIGTEVPVRNFIFMCGGRLRVGDSHHPGGRTLPSFLPPSTLFSSLSPSPTIDARVRRRRVRRARKGIHSFCESVADVPLSLSLFPSPSFSCNSLSVSLVASSSGSRPIRICLPPPPPSFHRVAQVGALIKWLYIYTFHNKLLIP